MVSVCMITYNHELYIRDALDGVVMQKTNFKIELIIGEDCSNDGTRKICEDYAAKYPKLIQLLPSDRNLGMSQNGIRTLESCKGNYIALIDGDDYWTDPLKLQKQVDFLENNPEFVLCFHDARIIDWNNKIKGNYLKESLKGVIDKNKLKRGANILPLTLCFRNVIKEFPNEFFKVPNADTFLISLLGTYGKGFFLSDIKKSCYRHHSLGIWSSKSEFYKQTNRIITYHWIRSYYKRKEEIDTYKYFNQIFYKENFLLVEEHSTITQDVQIVNLYLNTGQFRTSLWFGLYKSVFKLTGRGHFLRKRYLKSLNL